MLTDESVLGVIFLILNSNIEYKETCMNKSTFYLSARNKIYVHDVLHFKKRTFEASEPK